MQAFTGIRVLDLTQYIAGPHCAQFLAAMGADVIKVEPPYGDPYRGFPATFVSFNLGGKKSVGIDLKRSEGRDIAQDVAASADVIIQSYRPGTVERLGLDYGTIVEDNESVVYCSISGFGRDGPYADRPATDGVAQAMSALNGFIGHPAMTNLYRERPVLMGNSLIDMSTGVHAFGEIAAALFKRERTGEGTHIDVSLYDVAMSYNAGKFVAHSLGTELPLRNDGKDESDFTWLAPSGVFYDGNGDPIYLNAITPGQYEGLCASFGREDLLEDDRFETHEDRWRNHDELRAELEQTFADYTREEIWAKLADAGVPSGLYYDVSEVPNDPHVTDRGMLVDSRDVESGEDVTVPQLPVRTVDGPVPFGGPPPELGEHTRQVLDDLGYADERVDELIEDEVVVAAD